MIKWSTGVVVGAWLVCCGGCVLSASSVRTTSGSSVPRDVFRQVKDGETTRGWLIENLGQPIAAEDRGDGMEDLVYEITNRVEEHFSVFLLVSLETSIDRVEQWVFEMKDDVVQRHHRNTIRRASEDFND